MLLIFQNYLRKFEIPLVKLLTAFIASVSPEHHESILIITYNTMHKPIVTKADTRIMNRKLLLTAGTSDFISAKSAVIKYTIANTSKNNDM